MRTTWMVAVVLLSASVNAAGRESVPGRNITAATPKIDGTINEDEWAGAASFSGFVDQDTGYPVEEGGDFWLAYDQRFVYFAARLEDREPNRIQATEYRTNVGLRGNDSVTLQLDPFGNLADFNQFSMNARGASNIQIAGGRAAKREWLGDIATAGRITKTGWEVEARIPWSVMRLPAAGVRDLRFNVYRDFRRYQRTHAWAYTGGGKIENFGRWEAVSIPATPDRTLKLLPYVYAGYDQDEKTVLNSGLDLRTELTERLDLVGSINPDFRNIENQVLSLDFSYFERLAAESRPFFLEGRGALESPIFASQRIGSFDAGAKVFGKWDEKTDFGLLDAIDFDHENSFVTKARRQVASRTSIDAAWSDYSAGSTTNQAGLVSFWQGVGAMNLFGQHAFTIDSSVGKGDRTNLGGSYYRNGLRYDLSLARVTSDYHPRLGYAPETDYQGLSTGFGQSRLTNRYGLMETGYGVSFNHYKRIDGAPYRERLSVNTSTTWKDGTDLDFYFSAENFHPYRDRVVSMGLERPRGDAYRRWSIDIAYGDVGGAPYRNHSFNLLYRPLTTLQLSASQQFAEYQHERHSQTILSANYDLGRDMSISGRGILRDGKANGYLAFRRSGNRGAEYFLIVGDPNAETFRTSVILKVVVPFEIPLSKYRSERRVLSD